MNRNDDFALGFGHLVSLNRSDGRKYTHMHRGGNAHSHEQNHTCHSLHFFQQVDLKYRRKLWHSLLMETDSLCMCSRAEAESFCALVGLLEYLPNPIPSKLKLLTLRQLILKQFQDVFVISSQQQGFCMSGLFCIDP